MAGMAVSRLISVEDIEQEHGMTQAQISDKLRIKHPQVKGYLAWVFKNFAERLILEETVS